jgi:hypothetical protein
MLTKIHEQVLKFKANIFISLSKIKFLIRASNQWEKYSFIEKTFQLNGYLSVQSGKSGLDAKENCKPWFTFPFLEFLGTIDFSNKCVFEYGTGASTLYWEANGANVFGVDHDEAWHDEVSKRLKKPENILFKDNKIDYANSILLPGIMFDVVVIDGNWRNECLDAAFKVLPKCGMVILDNADWYVDVYEKLIQENFVSFDFSGTGPANNYCWTTSLFVKDPSVLQRKKCFPVPVNGIRVQRGNDW